MNVVVSDAGPLQYLILSEAVDALPKLFDQVLIPHTVAQELQHPATPLIVADWFRSLPRWAFVEFMEPISNFPNLDPGEAEAIALATQNKCTLLIDETAGRDAARQLGIPIIGTIGLIERAAQAKLIDASEVVARLRSTNIFLSRELLDRLARLEM